MTSQLMHKEEGKKGRIEDRRFLTGSATYTDDIKLENITHLGILRSTYAHARIKSISFSSIEKDPHLVATITGQDLIALGVSPLAEIDIPGSKKTNRFQLAVSKTRYVGEPIAAIVADNKYAIEDLLKGIEVDSEPLAVVSNIEDSRSMKSVLYEDWKDTNQIVELKIRKGDPESAIASSKHIVRAHFAIRRQAGTPIEPRSVVASYDRESGVYEVVGSVQSVHRLRTYLSTELKVSPDKIHARVLDVGGSFGTKGAQSYAASVLACILARKTGRPVMWTSTRTEDLLESAQGRDEYCDIELSCDENARITALRANIVTDAGVGGSFKVQAMQTARLLPGAYHIPNIGISASSYVTNKAPSGPVRGAGRPEASFFIEMIVTKMARQLGMDPLEFRTRNTILPTEFPYDNGAGLVYDSGNLPKLLELLHKSSNYQSLVQWKNKINSDQSSEKNKKLRAGLGVSLIVEDTGSQLMETAKIATSSQENKLQLFTGSSPHGQGHETTLAQIAAKELGISTNDFKVLWGDTDYLKTGVGTFGSRSVSTGGSAVIDACRKFKANIEAEAAHYYSIPGNDVELFEGCIVRRTGGDTKSETIWEFLKKLGKIIESSSEFVLKGMPFASGAHLCTLLVDIETGKVEITRYFVVDDCGRVINEVIVDGQISGGVAHGIGGALFEEVAYNEEGSMLTSNFLDYLIPTSNDVPDISIVHFETPSPVTLSGAKGVGESGTIGAYPAILSAINDALNGVGIEINVAPVTPESITRSFARKDWKANRPQNRDL